MEHYLTINNYFPVPNRREPGTAAEYGNIEHSYNWSSLKTDAPPFSYTCIKNFPTPLQTLIIPSKFPPTSFPNTPASNYRNGIADEVPWSYKKTGHFSNSSSNWCAHKHTRHTTSLHGDPRKDNTTVESWPNLCSWTRSTGI